MIDGIIVIVVLLSAWLGWRKGLFRTLAELAAVVIALLLSAQIAGAAEIGRASCRERVLSHV